MAHPSLAMIPSGYKATKLYSVLPESGAGDFTVVRNSVKTRVNSLGVIETLAANVPSIDYVDGGCPVLNREAQSTNLALWSEDFTKWTILNLGDGTVTVTPNNAISPDGTMNASTFIFSSKTSGNTLIRQTVSVPTTATLTPSIYARSNSNTTIDIRNGSGALFSTLNITNEWKKINSLTQEAAAGSLNFEIQQSNNLATTIEFWGAELKSSNSSYIKTEGTTQTRLEDVITVAPPAGTTSITETIDGVEQTPITVIPATYQIPNYKLGVEKIINGGFDTDTDWILTGETIIENGKAHIKQSDALNSGITQTINAITNKTYLVTGVISDYVLGSLRISSIGSTNTTPLPQEDGEFSVYYTSTRSTLSPLNIQRLISPCDMKIDNVSVREVLPIESGINKIVMN